jgi:hypothetical protein
VDYIERYTREVAKLLPKKGKAEKLQQLRQDLERKVNKIKSESNIIDMDGTQYEMGAINAMGAPYKVAKDLGGGYRPLVSEEAMPTFLLVLKIVAIVHGVLVIVVWAATGFNFLEFFGIAFGMGRSLLSNAAIIAIIFHFLDRSHKFKPEDWKIEDLPQLPKQDKVKVPSMLISIGFNSFFLIYFLLFPERIGYGYFEGGEWVFNQVTDGFILKFLPFICILMITRIFLNVMEVKLEYYTLRLRILEVLQSVAIIALCSIILKGDTSLTFTYPSSLPPGFTGLLTKGAYFFIILIIFGSIIDIGKHGYALFKELAKS